MATKIELELRETLLTTGLVQPIKTFKKGSKVSALCRQVPGQEAAWLKALHAILVAFKGAPEALHVCRQYVLKDDKMVFGWYVSLEGSATELKGFLDILKVSVEGLEPEEPMPDPAYTAKQIHKPGPGYVSPYAKEDPMLLAEMGLAGTTAAPRPPSMSEDEILAPLKAGAPSKITLVTKGIDQKTKQPVVVQEMPLSGVYDDDMNVPNAKGKGAKYLG